MAKEVFDFSDYMDEVTTYNEKVRRGRAVRKVDPNQPAFSETSEMLRQTGKKSAIVPSTIAERHERIEPESFDFGEGDTTPEVLTFDSTEAKPVRSRGYSERYQEYRPQSYTKPNDPNRTPAQALDPLFQELTAPLAAARDTLLGGTPREVADRVFGPPSTNWTENILPGTMEGLLDIIPAVPLMVIPGPKGKGPSAGPTPTVPPVAPLTQDQLAAQVAERALTKSAIETRAFPDAELVPQVRQGTGRTLITPSFETGELTTTTKGGVERVAKGRFGRQDYPAMQTGEYGTGEQTTLLGGHNVLGDAPHLTGKYALTPGEQLPVSAIPLREQQLTKGGTTAEQQQAYSDFITSALRTRVLTPEMERTLSSPYELQGSLPITMLPSKSGKSISVELADQGVKIPKDLTVGNTLNGAAYPNLYARVAGSIVDAVRSVKGPLGQGIADMADAAYTIRAARTSQAALDATKGIDQIFGRTSVGQRLKTRSQMFAEGENAALTGERTIWGVTPAQEEEAFNYLYTNGRMIPKDPKAKALADTVYEKFLYPASSDPDVRALPGVLNPFTGKYTPFGEPNKFMPQQPIHEITANAIKDTQWRILYERKGLANSGISLEQFKDTVIRLSRHDPEVTAAKAQGLENMRLLDLEALGGSPYQWAKKLGYRTDVFQAGFHYHSLATLRGQLGRIEKPIQQLIGQIPATEADTAQWLTKAANHILMKPNAAFDTTTRTINGIKAASHVMDMTMLQKALLANTAQGAYVAARGGLRASLKGTFDLLTKTDRDVVERSGALFPSLLNELTVPTGPMARWSSIAFRLYGVSYADRMTRYFAGHVGNRFIQQVEQSLLRKPDSTRLQGLIKELGGDPKVLLEQGKIPEDMRYQMIQRFANYTSGVTDPRGLPLWASSQNPWFRLINKYRSFAASNSGEIRRAIFNAPTAYDGAKRAATLLAGAYTLGSGIKTVGTDLINELMGNDPKPTKESVWRAAEPLVYGLGTLEGMMVVNAAQDPARAVISLTGGPSAGVAVSFLDDLKATAEHGVGWRSLRTMASRTPVLGPVLGPAVKGEAKRQTAAEQYLKE